jgi:hypothetical protein
MERSVDAISQFVRLLVGEGLRQVAKHYPHQHVLLSWARTEPYPSWRGPIAVRRGREDGDLFDAVGIVADCLAYAVAQCLLVVTYSDRDRGHVSQWHGRHRSVGARSSIWLLTRGSFDRNSRMSGMPLVNMRSRSRPIPRARSWKLARPTACRTVPINSTRHVDVYMSVRNYNQSGEPVRFSREVS